MDWTNLYQNDQGIWLRGNLHTHSGEGMTLDELLGCYAGLGYDFISVTDHMKITIPAPRDDNALLILPGVEWNSKVGEHTTLISLSTDLLEAALIRDDHQAVMAHLAGKPVLMVLNHPNWRVPPHYSRETLMDRPAAAGIEIYNAKGEGAPGEALATGKWDYLLSRGRKLLGFAGDDAHGVPGAGQGWLMLRAAERTFRAVFESLRAGNFYCSSGVTFDRISRRGSVIEIAAGNAEEIWAVGEWGTRLQRCAGGSMRFDFTAINSPYRRYVRFEAFGRGAARGWTQPFFETADDDNRRLSPFVSQWKVAGRLLAGPLADVQPASLSDASMEWREVTALEMPEGFVGVTAIHGKSDGVCLLGVRVRATESGVWTIGLGHDGGAKLLVDGKPVIHDPRPVNPALPDRSRADIALSRGEHEVIVALDTRGGMGQGIFLRFMIPEAVRQLPDHPVFPVAER